jgi:putative spermidine/putrescine transport system substrate-binding protein
MRASGPWRWRCRERRCCGWRSRRPRWDYDRIKQIAAEEGISELRMTEAGGPSGESIEQGYLNPFAEKSGTRVVRENPSGLGKLGAMVEAGAVTSVLLELSSPELEQAKALDLVEPLDWDAIDPLPMFEEAQDEQGYGYQYYSTIMAWRGREGAAELAGFLGCRGLSGQASAAGLHRLYPADGAARRRRPGRGALPARPRPGVRQPRGDQGHVAVGWQAGAQPPQLLQDNEVQYAVAWSGRVAGQEGIDYTFQDGQLDIAFFVVPKGADPQQKEAAMGIFYEMSVPENQAVAADVVSYTGNSPDLEPLLPQDRVDEFPTTAANKEVQFLSDARWWFENAEEVETRWQEFKLGL